MVAQPIDLMTPHEAHFPVTPAIARHWLEAYQLPRQRPVVPYHVRNLAHEASRDELFGAVIIFAHTAAGGRYLLDGQHRLQAVIRSGKTIEFAVAIFAVRDVAAAQRLYTKLDQGRARTPRTLYETSDVAGALDLTMTEAERFGAVAIPLIEGFGARRHLGLPARYRLRVQEDWREEMHAYRAMVRGARLYHKFLRAEVLAVGLVTTRFQPRRAEAFWTAVAGDSGLERDTGEHHAARLIGAEKQRQPRYELARQVARCWEVAWNARKVAVLRPGAVERPIAIVGTPLEGKDALAYDPDRLEFVPAAEVFADVAQ